MNPQPLRFRTLPSWGMTVMVLTSTVIVLTSTVIVLTITVTALLWLTMTDTALLGERLVIHSGKGV